VAIISAFARAVERCSKILHIRHRFGVERNDCIGVGREEAQEFVSDGSGAKRYPFVADFSSSAGLFGHGSDRKPDAA
jgi:hypothetical protein